MNLWKISILNGFLLKLRQFSEMLKRNQFVHGFNFREELIKQVAEYPEIIQYFSNEKMKKHYVYEPIRDTTEHPDLLITQLRFNWYRRFFKIFYPDIFEKDITVLDVGGTSEFFLASLGKQGTVLSINQECIDYLTQIGFDVLLCDAELIDLPDKSFDYVICFQMLEHVPNPIRVLNELGRVARKKVFLSIPFTTQTQIYNIDYWVNLKKTSWKEVNVKKVDCHIFEFSTQDLKNILSYTNLEYDSSSPIYYFRNNTELRRLYNHYFGSYFNFFVLSPKK